MSKFYIFSIFFPQKFIRYVYRGSRIIQGFALNYEHENDLSNHSSSFEFSITSVAMFCFQLHVSIKSYKVRTFTNESHEWLEQSKLGKIKVNNILGGALSFSLGFTSASLRPVE